MDITFEDIESITTSVWSTVLDREISPHPGLTLEDADISHVGIIALAGAFSGVVSVHLSESVVRGAASQMFQAPAGAVDADEMRDAVAELTNMVGGNVKCLVPQPTQLGLPEVLTRAEAEGRLCPTVEEARLGFASPDGRLFVMLHQSAAA